MNSFKTASMARVVATAALALALNGCASAPDAPPRAGPQRVSVMTFNVENLFDTRHDPGKNDFTFLPAATKTSPEHVAACEEIPVVKWRNQCLYWDWNEAVLEVKFERLAKAILGYGDGRGPDVLVVQEVENRGVLERLRREHLGAAGYRPAVLLEGRDKRGIDVGFLSRLEVVGQPRLHQVPFTGIDQGQRDDTRGFLEATFRLPDGSLLTGFAVHFPAPFHPYDLRIQSYQHLSRLVAALPAGRLAFAAGDFNTPATEDLQQKMLERYVTPHWQVAHLAGCDDCRGTYYYAPKDEWSYLDMILLSRNLLDGSGNWRFDPAATTVSLHAPEQVAEDGSPAGFDLPGAVGVSDHWPLAIEIQAN